MSRTLSGVHHTPQLGRFPLGMLEMRAVDVKT